jgi:tRNA-dihydrouridine synthase B
MIPIGSYKLNTRVVMAPMSGCTDLATRLIAREHGAKFAFFEMIDAHSVFYHRKKTISMLKTHPCDRPIALQLLGSDADIMLKAAERVLSMAEIPLLDINAACPARKVLKKRAGAYLLKDPEKLYTMIKKLVKAARVPVTVKIRTGYDVSSPEDIAGIAAGCAEAGASAIFVHGRTMRQMYSGEVDYDSISAVKKAAGVPVFGSGNIFSSEDAKRMVELTGCDGVLVARGGLGNPWIFAEIESVFSGGSPGKPASASVRAEALKRHIAYIDEHSECRDSVKAGIMRRVALWYIKSFRNARRIREKISVVKDPQKMLEFISSIKP